MSNVKFLKYADLLESECSMEACTIIIAEYNGECERYGLETVSADADLATTNKIALESVMSVLKAMGKGILRGVDAATSFLGNSVKKMIVKTKHAESVVGRLNATAETITGSPEHRYIDTPFVAAFWPKAAVTDFKYLQTVLNDSTSKAAQANDIAKGLSTVVLSLRGCTDFSTLDSAMSKLTEIVSKVLDAKKPVPGAFSVLAKLKYNNTGKYKAISHQFKLYNKALMVVMPRNYSTDASKPYAAYTHIKATEKGKSIAVPSSGEMTSVVKQANRSLREVMGAAKVSSHYNNFASDMRDAHASLSTEDEHKKVAAAAHDCISGIYDVYKALTYSLVMDSIYGVELFAIIAEACVAEYK